MTQTYNEEQKIENEEQPKNTEKSPLSPWQYAQETINSHGKDILFCETNKDFYLYNSELGFWEKDKNQRKIKNKIILTMEKIGHAKYITRRRLDDIVHMSKIFSDIVCQLSSFDKNPHFLNLINGTFDLDKGTLLEHDRTYRITKISYIRYDKEAKADSWDKYINRVTDSNKDLMQFIQMSMGYLLCGAPKEQSIFIIYGEGGNGKSVFNSVLMGLLGTYGETFDINMLNSKDFKNKALDLYGLRLLSLVETSEKTEIDETLLKQVTGQDKITANTDEGNFEYMPAYKLLLITNHKPTITGIDEATWRRIKPIHFKERISEEEKDISLIDKLKDELSGILIYAIDGYKNWKALTKLQKVTVIDTEIEKYRREMDIIASFINECCELGINKQVSTTTLYEKFLEWSNYDKSVYSMKSFSQQLKRKNFTTIRGFKGRMFWQEIGLIVNY